MKNIIAVFMLFFSTLVSATTLNKIVVFGDSLSDNGNMYEYMKHLLPVSPPYYEGRFTNGPVWVETIAHHYYPGDSMTHFQDYAFGGAGVMEDYDPNGSLFTFTRELDTYLLAHDDKADENGLYIVWIGSNNYLGVSDITKPEEMKEIVTEVMTGIRHDLKRLADKGAKHILVVNLPDLGKIPAARDLDATAILSSYANQHNHALEQDFSQLQRDYPDVQWIYFDVREALNDVMDYPEAYGFTNTDGTCYEAMIEKHSPNAVLKMVSTVEPHLSKDACTGYLFFDPVHPAAPAHRIMAEKTIKLLDDLNIKFQ